MDGSSYKLRRKVLLIRHSRAAVCIRLPRRYTRQAPRLRPSSARPLEVRPSGFGRVELNPD